MQSASSSTYVSAKQIKAIQSKRENLQKQKSQSIKEDSNEQLDSDEYDEKNRSFAEVDSDELDGELNLSDDEGQA